VVDRRGTRAVAEAYLEFLYSPAGQELVASHFYRPRDAEVAARHAGQFPALETFSIVERFGGWAAAQARHFDEGGEFDRMPRGAR
jgi:sulfate transport system substrate-binding protein